MSSAGYVFSGLSSTTLYEIVVVAQNDAGFDTARIAQDTGNLSPILYPLGISASDGTSLTLAQPTLSTIGTPIPGVKAFLGVDGSISVILASVIK
ncbi:MAG: hypothetical protein K8S54_02385 [Spirochaetia bacterium]|nr:hypothetical protein [Spirochaetia bacterium]